ncbi:unnamed protein product, partial [Urochloa humidicola]
PTLQWPHPLLLRPSPILCHVLPLHRRPPLPLVTPSSGRRHPQRPDPSGRDLPPMDQAPDPRRGVPAPERRGPERLETEGSSSTVLDPPILALEMDSSVEKASPSPH